MLWIILLIFLFALAGFYVFLSRDDLAHLDRDTPLPEPHHPSPAYRDVLRRISELHKAGKHARGKQRLIALRQFMDSMGEGLDLASRIEPRTQKPPYGEWVIPPDADPARRILYIHGGAWLAGSPKSHRAITDRLAQTAGACVFAVDYRLLPEHRYRHGLRDCYRAYEWLLQNGPDESGTAEFMVVAGDSAGASHALVLQAQVRDQGLRQPDAVVALGPATDLSFGSPSLSINIPTDPLLGPSFGQLKAIPKPLLELITALALRIWPRSPLASPVRGDLSGLAPTLIQASSTEMLLDNALRYANKAQDAGSPVEVQLWDGMVHVWHIFTPDLPEAEEAFRGIGDFLKRVEARTIAPEARQ